MISQNTIDALNAHLVLELEAYLQYLAMASWCEREGLEGSSNFFYLHAEEENVHFQKIFRFINEVNGHAKVPQAGQAILEFDNVKDACEKALANEQKVTRSINKLVELAQKENDHTANEFLRFFVDEQLEEETLFQKVLDKIKLIGDGPMSLYYIDQELEKLAAPESA